MTTKIGGLLLLVAIGLAIATCGGGSSPTDPDLQTTTGEQGGSEGSGGSGSFDEFRCPTPGNADKVLVCHFPPGNPDNARSICVDDSAASAHLAHGDYLGECAVCAPGDPYCCAPGDPYCAG